MRNILIILLLSLVSCAEMHDPILHGGGMIRFAPQCSMEVDSVIIHRMSEYFEFTWEKEMFYKDLDDFHVKWWSEKAYEIDFIKESECIRTPYGKHNIIWSTNGYHNNIQENNIVFTEHLNDTICQIPDFVYSKKGEIYM